MAHIVSYFIEAFSSDKERKNDFKSLRESSFQMFKEGHIQKILFKGGYGTIIIKCQCLTEMRKDRVYNIMTTAYKKYFIDVRSFDMDPGVSNPPCLSDFLHSVKSYESKKNVEVTTLITQEVEADKRGKGKCSWSPAQLKAAGATYFKSRKDAKRRTISGKVEEHKTICRRQGRMRDKMQRRLDTLEKNECDEDTKRKMKKALTLQYTSSDESEVSEDEQSGVPLVKGYLVKKLAWERSALRKIKQELDKNYLKELENRCIFSSLPYAFGEKKSPKQDPGELFWEIVSSDDDVETIVERSTTPKLISTGSLEDIQSLSLIAEGMAGKHHDAFILQSSPIYNDAMNGNLFPSWSENMKWVANSSLNAKLKRIKEQGQSKVQHHPYIQPEDIKKCYESRIFSGDTPLSLLRVNWFNISLFFCRRGRENQRQLKKTSFVIQKDANSIEYVKMSEGEKTKNHPGDLSDKADEGDAKMFSTGEKDCPVDYLKQLLSVLNPEEEALFQRPKRNFIPTDKVPGPVPVPLGSVSVEAPGDETGL
ncbi:hypothetical protein QZH41_005078 [Actinostola sp. cb2023]|nr:hypothetical protein QZH41_005078 [Actinostola sp. cb2023]